MRTHVAVLHASDVRAQAAVRGGQGLLHAALQLVEADGETGEIVHLEKEAQTPLLRMALASAHVHSSRLLEQVSVTHSRGPAPCIPLPRCGL